MSDVTKPTEQEVEAFRHEIERCLDCITVREQYEGAVMCYDNWEQWQKMNGRPVKRGGAHGV